MEIKEETLGAIRNAVYGLHKRLAEVGAKVAKSFRPDELYKRDNSLEAIGSGIRSCENTLGALERAVEGALSDIGRDPSAVSALAPLKAERDHLRKLINSDWTQDDGSPPVLPH